MNIIIRDDQGLDTALMMDGYSREQRQDAKQAIRAQFGDAANRVFQEILGKPLPETIIVNMAISDNEELKGESAARLASFNAELSRADSSIFTIREITVKTVLEHSDLSLFKSTVIHEMFHAADLPMLDDSYRLFDKLRKNINDNYASFNWEANNGSVALLNTLQVFNHYRAEGVAILGECLLTKKKFASINNATAQFCKVFEMAMMRAQRRTSGHHEENALDRNAFHMAYAVAPIILVMVLEKRGDIKHELATKALEGLEKGEYELNDAEIRTIMRSALALTLTGYIQGLMSLGDQVAPIRPFLDFCISLQHDGDEENTNAYEQLINLPKSTEVFDAAMNQIMGCCMPEEELEVHYNDFITSTANGPLYPQMKEKVGALYNVFKNDDNQDRQRLAQWALTYFFDDEDIIHDDVSGLGLVDDMTVIDYAIRLLQP